MPWTNNDYPNTFKNMTSEVRDKAIEIGNELLNQYEEPRAIRIATAQAKEWAGNRDIKIWEREPPAGRDQHVVPRDNGWAVLAEGADQATELFDKQSDARSRAGEIAHNQATHVVIHDADGKISDVVQP